MAEDGNAIPRGRRAAPEVRQADILEAALAEFAQHGFSAARVEDVARRARVSKGTVYLYYPTKQALFEALVQRDVAPRVSLITFFLDSYDGPLEPALMRIADMAGPIIENGQLPVYPKLLMAEAARFPDLAQFYRREVVEKMLGSLAGVFQRAMTRGEIAAGDPVMTAHLFIAPFLKAIMWSLVFAPTEETPFPPAPYLQAHVRLFLAGMKETPNA